MKKFLLAIALMTTVAAFAGCGAATDEPTPADDAAVTTDDTTVTPDAPATPATDTTADKVVE
jgi:ABC-type glycerol-3-phosphate transport system substrate-binding protein